MAISLRKSGDKPRIDLTKPTQRPKVNLRKPEKAIFQIDLGRKVPKPPKLSPGDRALLEALTCTPKRHPS
jgi:hypothetical protein